MSRRSRLDLVKYSAAGNDFLIVDEGAEPDLLDASKEARALCRRAVSIGADGLIVLRTSDARDGAVARMRLWNADGSLAEFSGNGARCVVRYLADQGHGDGDIVLDSDIGLVRGSVDGRNVRVAIPGEARVWPQRRIRVEGRDLIGTYVLVGVPFFVLLHEDPDELPIRFLGRAIRNHPDLRPAGANVDFVRVDDEQNLTFRVYERGVENETLSSGTGSIAAALASCAAGRTASPVACHARGGTLTVRFRPLGAEKEPADFDPQTAPAPAPPTDDDRAAGDARDAEIDHRESAADEPADGETQPSDGSPDVAAEGSDEPVPGVARIMSGPALRFGQISIDGDTRRVASMVAQADAFRIR